MTRRVGYVAVDAVVWERAAYDDGLRTHVLGEVDHRAEQLGGIVEPGGPEPHRGVEPGGRPVFNDLARVATYIFWVIREESE